MCYVYSMYQSQLNQIRLRWQSGRKSVYWFLKVIGFEIVLPIFILAFAWYSIRQYLGFRWYTIPITLIKYYLKRNLSNRFCVDCKLIVPRNQDEIEANLLLRFIDSLTISNLIWFNCDWFSSVYFIYFGCIKKNGNPRYGSAICKGQRFLKGPPGVRGEFPPVR